MEELLSLEMGVLGKGALAVLAPLNGSESHSGNAFRGGEPGGVAGAGDAG